MSIHETHYIIKDVWDNYECQMYDECMHCDQQVKVHDEDLAKECPLNPAVLEKRAEDAANWCNLMALVETHSVTMCKPDVMKNWHFSGFEGFKYGVKIERYPVGFVFVKYGNALAEALNKHLNKGEKKEDERKSNDG